jgi:hypothetical protein
VRIIRYVKIRGDVNPYDPKWDVYLEARLGWQLSQTLTGRDRIEYLWKEQGDDASSVVNRCGSQRKTCTSTIASGAAEAVLTRPTTRSCCMSTAIGRSMCKND